MKKRLLIVFVIAILFVAATAIARVGGGESYSGGGSSGGGGGGEGEIIYYCFRFLLWLTVEHPVVGIPVDIIVIVCVVKYKKSRKTEKIATISTRAVVRPRLDGLRRFDPNFSEIVFRDFCYSLYARVHEARGRNDLGRYAPYVSDSAQRILASRNPSGLREVRGIVIGSMNVVNVQGLDLAQVSVTVAFEANYTEVAESTQSWYVREEWVLERKRDILSPPPEKARADHCPRCGAPLKTRTDGACESCGVKIANGNFQWYVRLIRNAAAEKRGPLLASNVPEQATQRPTIRQPGIEQYRAAFAELEPRVRAVARELQDAWTARDWERVRPLESEGLFQMHRYWIDAYVKQKLRNVVNDFTLVRIEPVKFATDAFYESMTVRLFANGRDFTTDESGGVVAGSKTQVRSWSEYWTFIRTRASASGTMSCPNCGATVAVGTTGVCSFCGGKLTTGAFDWVLSSIEQDEAYAG